VEVYPNARFLWSHPDPTRVRGSVCNLIHYTRSWSSDRDDSIELGAEQLNRWWEAVQRAMEFRERTSGDRFADISFSKLQTDPLAALEKGPDPGPLAARLRILPREIQPGSSGFDLCQ
jgi:hypothetical protein